MVVQVATGASEEAHPLSAKPAQLAVQGLCLTLKRRVVLGEISLEVHDNEFVAILGAPGAGKTALMHCIVGLRKPDRGVVWLEGTALGKRSRAHRARYAAAFASASLDKELSARTGLSLAAQLHGIPRLEARQRADELLAFMGLKEHADGIVGNLPPAVGPRLELARALIHDPRLLLVDSPPHSPSALARQARPLDEETWDRLQVLRRVKGLSMLLATACPEEAQRCDRVVVLDRGRVAASGSVESLVSAVGGDVLTVESHDPEAVRSILEAELRCSVEVEGRSLRAVHEDPLAKLPDLTASLPAAGIVALSVRRANLADAVRKLTGQTLAWERPNIDPPPQKEQEVP